MSGSKELSDQEYADKFFGGDNRRYAASIREGHKDAISWNDLAGASEVLTEYSLPALNLIRKHLGYLPDAPVYTPHELYLRALLKEHQGKTISDRQLAGRAAIHIRHIRNDDIRKNGFIDNIPLTQHDLEKYQSYRAFYKEIAEDRVTTFFGGPVKLDYRLHAELLLRDYYFETHDFAPQLSETDYKVFTITAYLWGHFEQGKQFALESPLLTSQWS